MNITFEFYQKKNIMKVNLMKCKCVVFPLKEEKAEPRINEWLENNSNLKIKFVSQAIIDGRRRVCYYYED